MNDRNLILGVDGGGSSSKAVVFDGRREIMNETHVGPLSFKSSSFNVVKESLLAIHSFIEPISCNLKYAVFGLSGLDEPQEVRDIIALMADVGIIDRRYEVIRSPLAHVVESEHGFLIALCSDALLPLFANGLESGSIVISGTGSIGLSVDRAGYISRYGGWGYSVSDRGSGTWVGMRFLSKALRSCDLAMSLILSSKPVPKKDIALINDALRMLFPEWEEEMSLEESIACIRDWSTRNADPKTYAVLAKPILQAAYQDSSACLDVAQEAVKELGILAELSFMKESPDILLSGGLFKNEKFAQSVVEEVSRRCEGESRTIINDAISPLGAFGVMEALGPTTRSQAKCL